MKPIANWNELKGTHPGDATMPPPGAYACRIVSVEETKSKGGRDMLKIDLDINDGDFKNHFTEEYNNRQERGWEPRWGLSLYQLTDGNSVGNFKGLIEDIEKSNAKYTFDFDTSKLKGKLVGVMLDLEEYEYNGKTRTRLKAGRTYTLKELASGDVGAPSVIGTDGKRRRLNEPRGEAPTPEPVDDIEIPF